MLVPEGTGAHGFHHYTACAAVELIIDAQRNTVAVSLVPLPAPAERLDAHIAYRAAMQQAEITLHRCGSKGRDHISC
jgi:hypothetical protein